MNATIASHSAFRRFARSLVKNPPKPGMTKAECPGAQSEEAFPDEQEEAEQEAEESALSFGKAFLIVLVIHLLAIGGFYAHGSISKALAQPRYAGIDQVAQDSKWLAENPPHAPPSMPPALPTVPKNHTPTPVPQKATAAKSEPQKPKSASPAKDRPEVASVKKSDTPDNPSAAPKWMERAQAMLAATSSPMVGKEVENRRAARVEPLAVPHAPDSHEVREALDRGEYTLEAGDTLYAVAHRLGVSFQELADANGIKDPRALSVGQRLKLPGSKFTSL